ncbi:hypothetical protein HK099_008348 [Clydaea vesicula]|uniref:Phosphatidate phosphatase APP1 catalytic domain-containing protein n=1 Tax=Clydaea vesicula TaxID=447962 RepID=A0AAD5TW74_9FUNG|nr:hypothetical protein HK099_008348 [Clydaea vesicula]
MMNYFTKLFSTGSDANSSVAKKTNDNRDINSSIDKSDAIPTTNCSSTIDTNLPIVEATVSDENANASNNEEVIDVQDQINTSDTPANKDVTINFAPTYAFLKDDVWNILVSGWVFKVNGTRKTRVVESIMSTLARLVVTEKSEQVLNERLSHLILKTVVENYNVKIELVGFTDSPNLDSNNYEDNDTKNLTLNLVTDSTGHFGGTIKLENVKFANWKSVKKVISENNLFFHVRCIDHDEVVDNFVSVIHEEGISVISDIDDTIKESDVHLGMKAMIQNALTIDATPVEGMGAVYKQLYNERKMQFHYVSAGPYTLVYILRSFLTSNFPFGTLHLRNVKVGGQDAMTYKIDVISKIMKDFPKRKFILIGDSGEKDVDTYAAIVEKFPSQVEKIFIRNVTRVNVKYYLKNLSEEDKVAVADAITAATIFEEGNETKSVENSKKIENEIELDKKLLKEFEKTEKILMERTATLYAKLNKNKWKVFTDVGILLKND